MKKYFVIVVLIALASCWFDKNSHAQTETVDLIEKVENGLANINRIKGEPTWSIEERMRHYGVPGMSIAVIKDHKIAWSKTYGVKDRDTQEPVVKGTLFQCASISKPVSASAALRMVETGLFGLDSNVNDYLESWKLPENKFTKKQPVTLKHLVSHKGGLTVHGFLGYRPDQKVPTLIELLDGKPPANSGAIRVDKIPGGSFRYSGGGYCVMQQMMMDQTKKSFPKIMRESVLEPLGMTHSTFQQPLSAERIVEAATGYLPDGSMVAGKRHTYPEMAPAGLWTTAEDLAKFAIELQLAYRGDSDKVLSQKMARRMIDESLGIFTDPAGEEFYFGHGGWNEGFSSDFKSHRDNGYGVVVLTNANQPPFIDEVMNSVAWAYQWANVVQEYEPLKVSSSDTEKIVGRYNKRGDLIKIFADDGKLFLQEFGMPPQELICVAPDKFVQRTEPHAIRFSTNPSTGLSQFGFQLPNEEDADLVIVGKKLAEGEKLPIELLESGEFEKAVSAYSAAFKSNSKQKSVQEEVLNNLGYSLIGENKTDFAIRVFRINTILYPNSFNVWDSLGEGFAKKGEISKAIKNYEKSVELNPGNTGGIEMLKKLKASKDKSP
jgi:CubicO group peptidase (beta-lactamase class C family)